MTPEDPPTDVPALAAVRSELAALGAPPAPAAVRARWTAALHAEGDRADSAPDRSPPDRPRSGQSQTDRPQLGRATSRRLRIAAAATVLVVATVGAVLTADRPAGPTDRSVGRLDPPSLASSDLATVAAASVGVDDLGPLSEPVRRSACLASAGADPVTPDSVLGGRPVRLDGVEATLLVLATGDRGRLRILVVDGGCGTVLADTTTG